MNESAPGIAGLLPGVWRSRGYIPHFEGARLVQHVTFRLADSLPREVLEQMEDELARLPFREVGVEKRKRLEEWLDAGHGCCVLGRPEVAEMVEQTLFFFDVERYRLMAWVVMPNHVHVLFEMVEGWGLAKVVGGWKSWTARRILEMAPGEFAGREPSGPRHRGREVWFREYWDRFVRNERHLANVIEYIHGNPVKAGLVERAEDWRFSSARFYSK